VAVRNTLFCSRRPTASDAGRPTASPPTTTQALVACPEGDRICPAPYTSDFYL
jgi:hypothetical protein